jgi:hypothetical protein
MGALSSHMDMGQRYASIGYGCVIVIVIDLASDECLCVSRIWILL